MTEIAHVHLDAVGGAAGDMFVAALLNALPALRPRVLADVVAVLPLFGCGKPILAEVVVGGIAALRFELKANEHESAHAISGHHPHGHHSHNHTHGPYEQGTYLDMRWRIEAADLSEGTAMHAAAILRALAEVEAGIHGVALEKVHFHEIGDWDSLMDVTAAGSIFAALPGVSWSVSELPLGSGLVKTAHGLLPVPTPATAALLRGYLWRDDGVPGERVTPTGAAILRHVTGGEPRANPGGRLIACGIGAGSRVLPNMPNILRASLFASGKATETEAICVLECDIDDMTGEEIGQASDRLRGLASVRDLVLVPGIGKKGRPLLTLRLLAASEDMDAVIREVLLETSTLGVRWHAAERRVLPRKERSGSLLVKEARRPDGETTAKVESDALGGIATLAARRAIKTQTENR
jgi:pyridinium-3,5-bisthiocarboxylic acid mononucleotide nickel chelatase